VCTVLRVHQGGTHIYTGVCVLKFSEQIKERHITLEKRHRACVRCTRQQNQSPP